MGPTLLYPSGRFRTATLSNSAEAVFTGGRHVKRAIIVGGAAAEIVIFRATADTPVYFNVPVAIGAHVNVEIDAYLESGLEILTASAAGDVEVTVIYVQP